MYNLRTAATTTATVALGAIPASEAVMVKSKVIARLAAANFTPLACETIGSFANNAGTVSAGREHHHRGRAGLLRRARRASRSANVAVTVFGQTSSTTDFMAVVDTTTN